MVETRLAVLLATLMFAGCATTPSDTPEDDWFTEVTDRAAFHRSIGRSLLERGDIVRANAELIKSLSHDEEAAETHYLLGQVYVLRGLPEDAEVSFQKAIRFDEEQTDAYAALAVLFDRAGRHEEADRMHREAIKREPNRAELHNNLGFSLLLRERYQDAIAVLKTALRLGAGKKTHNNLGFAYAELGDTEHAEREFMRGGTRAEAHNNLGWMYERSGDRARAQTAYEEAVRLDPKLLRAKKNLERITAKENAP